MEKEVPYQETGGLLALYEQEDILRDALVNALLFEHKSEDISMLHRELERVGAEINKVLEIFEKK